MKMKNRESVKVRKSKRAHRNSKKNDEILQNPNGGERTLRKAVNHHRTTNNLEFQLIAQYGTNRRKTSLFILFYFPSY